MYGQSFGKNKQQQKLQMPFKSHLCNEDLYCVQTECFSKHLISVSSCFRFCFALQTPWSLSHSLSHHLPPLTVWRHHAGMVWDSSASYKIDMWHRLLNWKYQRTSKFSQWFKSNITFSGQVDRWSCIGKGLGAACEADLFCKLFSKFLPIYIHTCHLILDDLPKTWISKLWQID